MEAQRLEKKKEYLYTAGAEPVRVTYLYETLNGYFFTDGARVNILHRISVEQYIEELK